MCYIKWGNSYSYAWSLSKTFFDIIIVAFRVSGQGLLKLCGGFGSDINMARTLSDTFLLTAWETKNCLLKLRLCFIQSCRQLWVYSNQKYTGVSHLFTQWPCSGILRLLTSKCLCYVFTDPLKLFTCAHGTQISMH